MAITNLRFWCQKVLPLVYDNSLSYYELLCKIAAKLNEVIDATNESTDNIRNMVEEILNEWLEDGTLEDIIGDVLDNLDTRVTTLEAEEANNTLRNEKCLLMGNSYAYGTGGVAGQGWCYYFEQITGCDADVIHQNGGDFIAVGNSNASYAGLTAYGALASFANSKTEAQRAQYKYVIYGGGYNDHGASPATLATAVQQFANYAKQMFPNAKVVIVPLFSGAPVTASKYIYYGEAICSGALTAGTQTTVNSFTWLYGRGYTNEDTIHPTDGGYKILGRYMASFVNGWDGIYEPIFGSGAEYEADVTSNHFRYTRDRNSVSFSGSLTITGEVGTVPRKLVGMPDIYLPAYNVYFPVFLFVDDVEDREIGICYLTRNGGGLWLANCNNTFPDGVTIYFGNTVSLV